jgi:hypothetical protein
MDRGNDTGDFNDTPFGWSEHLLIFVSPMQVVEGYGDQEVGYTVKPVVWVWEGGDAELGFGAPKHSKTQVYVSFVLAATIPSSRTFITSQSGHIISS